MTASALLAALLAAAPCPPAPPAGLVARAAAFGGVVAADRADADAAIVAGGVAVRAARRYLGLALPPMLIAPDGVPPGGCGFVFRWSPHPGAPLPSHVLPHEIGHAVFIRYLAPRTGADEYGGGAPDWLDEMAALAFEDGAGVAMRRRDTARLARRGELIPLARLLAMPHPEFVARSSAAAGLVQPASPDTPGFYATVRALFDFLLVRTGDDRIVRRLADRARAKLPPDAWLLAHVARDPAHGLAGLDAELAAFVAGDPLYRDSR